MYRAHRQFSERTRQHVSIDGGLEHEFLGGDNRVRKHKVWVRQDVGEDIQVAGDPHEVDADVVLGRHCHGVQGQVSPQIDGQTILVARPSIGDEEARFLGPLVAIETEMLIACLVEIHVLTSQGSPVHPPSRPHRDVDRELAIL